MTITRVTDSKANDWTYTASAIDTTGATLLVWWEGSRMRWESRSPRMDAMNPYPRFGLRPAVTIAIR